MPHYTVEDTDGTRLTLEGDSPPTEQELTDIFDQHRRQTTGTSLPISAPEPIPRDAMERAGRNWQIAGAAGVGGTPHPGLFAPMVELIPKLKTDVVQKILSIPAQFARDRLEMSPDDQPQSPFLEKVAQSAPSDKAASIATGVQHGVADLANYFTSPVGIATLGMGTLPATVQKGISIAFAAQMAKDTPELARQLGTELGKPESERDYKKIAEITTSAAGTVGFTALAAKHGLTPERYTGATAKTFLEPGPLDPASPVGKQFANAEAWANSFGGGSKTETRNVKPQAVVRPTQPFVPPEPGAQDVRENNFPKLQTPRQEELQPQIEELQRMIVTEHNPVIVHSLMQKLTPLRLEYEAEAEKGQNASIRQRKSTPVDVLQAPEDRQAVGEGVRNAEEPAVPQAQENQQAPVAPVKPPTFEDRAKAGIDPEHLQITVSQPQLNPDNGKEIPGTGFVQVDEHHPELGNTFSVSPEAAKQAGLNVPSRDALMSLPSGNYTVEQAKQEVEKAAKPATIRQPAMSGLRVEAQPSLGPALPVKPKRQPGDPLTRDETYAFIDQAMELVKERKLDPQERRALGQHIETARMGNPEPLIDLVQKLEKSAPPKETYFTRAKDFDRLMLEAAIPEGWSKSPDLLFSQVERSRQEGTDSIRGRIAQNKEMAIARRNAAKDLGLDPDKISDPMYRAQHVDKLKKYLEDKYHGGEKEDFSKAIKQGDVPAPSDELTIGDVLVIDGEHTKVTAIDPDTRDVTLEDGRKFGTQILKDGTLVMADEWHKAHSTDELSGFWPEPEPPATPQPPAVVPKLRPGEKGGELFQGSDQPFNLAGEKGTDAERVAAEKAAEAQRVEAAKKAEAEHPQLPAISREAILKGLRRGYYDDASGATWKVQQSGDGKFYVERNKDGARETVVRGLASISEAQEAAVNAIESKVVQPPKQIELGQATATDLAPAEKQPPGDSRLSPANKATTDGEKAFRASAEGQKAMASRASRIATVQLVNEAVGKLDPGKAYARDFIDSLPDSQIDKVLDELVALHRELKSPELPASQAAAVESAKAASKFAGDTPDGTRVDNFIKQNGRWYRVDDEGKLAKMPTNLKVHDQLEKKAGKPPAPPETRTPIQVLSQAGRVRIKLPEGATMVRVTDSAGRKADVFIADANRGENVFKGVDVRKIEAGRITKDKKFTPVEGEVKVEEVKREASFAPADPKRAIVMGKDIRMDTPEEIVKAINDPRTDISNEHRKVLSKLVETGLLQKLPGLKTEITDFISGDGGVNPVGEYVPGEGLMRFLRWSSAEVPVHEFFHHVWRFLSEEDRQFIKRLRDQEVARLAPQMGEGFSKGVSSDQFMRRGISTDLYHLANEGEFFTWLMTQRTMERFNQPEARGFVEKVRGVLKDLWTAFKDALGFSKYEDVLWREIISGKYEFNVADAQRFDRMRELSLAKNEQEYEKAKVFSRTRPALAESTVGALGDVVRMKDGLAEQFKLSENARRMLDLPTSLALYSRALVDIGGSHSIYGYIQAREWAKERTPTERWHVLQDAIHSLGNEERASLKLKEDYEAARAEIDSPEFRKRLNRLINKEIIAKVTEEKEETFRNIRAVEAAEYLTQLKHTDINDARFEQLQQDIRAVKETRDFAVAVGMKMDEVVSAIFPNYFEFGAPSRTAKGFTDLYLAVRQGRGIPVTDPHELALVRLAAEALSANRGMAEQMVWMARMRSEPDFAAAVETFGRAFTERMADDPKLAITQLVAREGKLASKAEAAKRAFLSLNKEVMRQIEHYSDLEGAFQVDQRMRDSAEWKNLVSTVNKDAGGFNIPRVVREEIQKGLYHEYSGKFAKKDPLGVMHDFELGTDKKTALEAQAQIQRWLDAVDAWRYDPKNENHPDQEYWQRERDLVDAVYNSQSVLNPGAVRSFLVQRPLGMPEFLFRQAKLPAIKVAQTATENWHRAYAVSAQWVQNTMAPLMRKVGDAAKSHKISASLGTKEYRSKIFNPLAWAYRHGIALRVGDTLYGHKLTKEDIALIRAEGAAENELHRAKKNIGAERVMPEGLTYDEWAKGVFAVRRSQEFGAEPGTTVSRNISPEGRILATEMAKLAPDNYAGITELLNQDVYWPWVERFLHERNPDYSQPSRYEPLYDEMYRKIDEGDWQHTAKGSQRPTIDDIIDFIEANSGDAREEIMPTVLGNMHQELSSFYKRFVEKENTDVTVISPSRDSGFTKGFERDASNSFMYDYGMFNRGEILSESLDSTQFFMQRLQRSLQSVEQTYKTLVDQLNKLPTDEARREFVKQQKDLFQSGDDFRDYEDIKKHHHQLKYFLDNLDLYGGKNASHYEGLSGLFRVTGDLVKSTVAGLRTAGRIFFDSAIKQSMVFGAMERFRLLSNVNAARSMVMSGFNMMVRGPAIMAGRRLHLVKEAEQAYGSLLEELYRTSPFFDQQYDYGLGTKTPTWDNIVNNLRMPYSHGGGYNIDLPNNPIERTLEKAGLRALSLLEVTLEPLTWVFPSLFYATAYDSVARQMFWRLKTLESRARATFDTYEKVGQLSRFDLDNPKSLKNVLTPKEIIGDGFVPATITEVSQLREFFKRGTDIDLNDAVLAFWKRLRDTPVEQRKNIRMLGADKADPAEMEKAARARMGAIASIGLFDIHHASPINRMWGMRRSTLGRIGFPLAGWPVQSFRQIFSLLGKSAGDPRFSPAVLTGISIVMGLGAMGLMVGNGDMSRRFMAKLNWLAFRKIDPLKTIGEGRDKKENAQIAMAESIGYISGLSRLTDAVFSEKSNKSAAADGVFIVQKIDDLLKYVSGVVHTGDITYGLAALANKDLPFFQWATSRLPGQQGLVNISNVRTLLHKFAPLELVRPSGGFSAPMPTALSPIKEKLTNAIYKGDTQGAAAAYEEFLSKAVELGRTDPDKLAANVMRSLNPYSMALTGHPTEDQRQKILNSLPQDHRQMLLDAETNYLAAAQNVGVKSDMVRKEPGETAPRASIGASGGGGGGTASFSGSKGGRIALPRGLGRAGLRSTLSTGTRSRKRLSYVSGKLRQPHVGSGRTHHRRVSVGRTGRKLRRIRV